MILADPASVLTCIAYNVLQGPALKTLQKPSRAQAFAQQTEMAFAFPVYSSWQQEKLCTDLAHSRLHLEDAPCEKKVSTYKPLVRKCCPRQVDRLIVEGNRILQECGLRVLHIY